MRRCHCHPDRWFLGQRAGAKTWLICDTGTLVSDENLVGGCVEVAKLVWRGYCTYINGRKEENMKTHGIFPSLWTTPAMPQGKKVKQREGTTRKDDWRIIQES